MLTVAHYLSFLALVSLLAFAPGPDTLITLRNTLIGGRAQGFWTAVGVSTAGTIQGVLAAAGLGAVIVHAEPVFQVVRWAGVLYLGYLGISALLSARRLRRQLEAEMDADEGRHLSGRPRRLSAWRQGFLSNATNPKVLVFNIAVLPQFVGSGGGFAMLMLYALTLVVVGGVALGLIVVAGARASRLLKRARVRSGIEASTGVVMLGFAGALALEG